MRSSSVLESVSEASRGVNAWADRHTHLFAFLLLGGLLLLGRLVVASATVPWYHPVRWWTVGERIVTVALALYVHHVVTRDSKGAGRSPEI